MKRVVISVTNDLVTDQRVSKVCSTLIKQNFDILLIGRKLPNTIPIKREYPIYRMKLLFKKGFLFYAEYNLRLFIKLLFTKKDLLLSNDLDTLLPNFFVSKLFNKHLVYDSHELFSEIPELIDRPKTKKVWLRIEKKILPKLDYCYTVSNSIANHYNNLYSTNFKAIRNLPHKAALTEKGHFQFNIEKKKIILYQGAVNIGRGIELMIDTIDFLEDCIFVIIGDGDILVQLQEKVNTKKLNKKVKFLGRITPNELKKLTPLADIGISLEEDKGLNYRYALPNKLFDYIQAEIPVLVSNLPEMAKIVQQYNTGEILYQRSPKALAKIITTMLNIGKEHWKSSLSIASNELIWEKESVKLKKIFNYFK